MAICQCGGGGGEKERPPRVLVCLYDLAVMFGSLTCSWQPGWRRPSNARLNRFPNAPAALSLSLWAAANSRNVFLVAAKWENRFLFVCLADGRPEGLKRVRLEGPNLVDLVFFQNR